MAEAAIKLIVDSKVMRPASRRGSPDRLDDTQPPERSVFGHDRHCIRTLRQLASRLPCRHSPRDWVTDVEQFGISKLWPVSEKAGAFHHYGAVRLKANWRSTADVTRWYASASVVSAERIAFNIKGNDYRLVVSVDFEKRIVWIQWIGTHKQYDRISAREVEHGAP